MSTLRVAAGSTGTLSSEDSGDAKPPKKPCAISANQPDVSGPPPSSPCLRCPRQFMRRPRLCAPQENAKKRMSRMSLCIGICLHAQTWLICSCKAEEALPRIAGERVFCWKRAATVAKGLGSVGVGCPQESRARRSCK